MEIDVKKTTSGLYIRNDDKIGLLVYSPYTGLTYAVHHSDSQNAYKWLNKKKPKELLEIYETSLGAGWATSITNFVSIGQRLLPSPDLWTTLPATDYPILINWFLTGKCPLDCVYCYAEDLMRHRVDEPNEAGIVKRAEEILRLKPLVVVLTGGDPLSSPYLETALELLSGKVGLVVDTSAYGFSEKRLQLFKKYNVNVRISLDSEIPALNQRQRPLLIKKKTAKQTALPAIDAICHCLDEGVTTTVQTVATKKNANNLVSLGDKLYRLGVRSWRVFKVAPSKIKMENYNKFVGTNTDSGGKYHGKKARGPYAYNFEILMNASSNRWNNEMDIQVTFNEKVNSVILLGPDGIFYTESVLRPGKAIIDDINPQSPSLESFKYVVDMNAHAERYLNATYKKNLI